AEAGARQARPLDLHPPAVDLEVGQRLLKGGPVRDVQGRQLEQQVQHQRQVVHLPARDVDVAGPLQLIDAVAGALQVQFGPRQPFELRVAAQAVVPAELLQLYVQDLEV